MSVIFAVLVLVASAFFIVPVWKSWQRITSIGKGKEEPRDDAIAQRFRAVIVEGLLQRRMYSDLGAAIMHLVIFWGFFVVSLGTLETLVSGIAPGLTVRGLLDPEHPVFLSYVASQDITNTLVLVAVAYAILRRLFFAPTRFASLDRSSRIDAYIVLGAIGGLVFSALLYWGSEAFANSQLRGLFFAPLISKAFGIGISEPQSWEHFSNCVWWLHVGNLFGLMAFLPHSKHQHLIWVWPNIFFKSRKSTGRLRPMVFDENAETFGVGEVGAFTWKQLLDSMACVECGRCTEVCPASHTGKQLNPRLIINQIKEAMYDADTNDKEKPKTLIGEITTPQELWGCTTCGACMHACPLHIEHIPAIIDMRRYLTMTEGNLPTELQSTLENLESNSNPWGFNNADRLNWAEGLNIKTMAEVSGEVDFLFWVGCAGAFDERYKKVSRAIVKILHEAKLSFAVLGTEEVCNGDTARRAGNEYLADMQIRQNIETFKRYKVKRVVTGCPHCFNTIKNEYPDFGFAPEQVVHHSELIATLARENRIRTPRAELSQLTYHDSCYLSRHNGISNAPREALKSALPDAQLVEMPRNKDKGFCCGAGGARMWIEEKEGEKINVNRSKEAIATGATTVATACPFCMVMMRDGIAQCDKDAQVEVKDIAEIVASPETASQTAG